MAAKLLLLPLYCSALLQPHAVLASWLALGGATLGVQALAARKAVGGGGGKAKASGGSGSSSGGSGEVAGVEEAGAAAKEAKGVEVESGQGGLTC